VAFSTGWCYDLVLKWLGGLLNLDPVLKWLRASFSTGPNYDRY